jgi:hypothetical protein
MFLNKAVRRFIPVTVIVGFLAAIPSITWADTITFNLEDQTLNSSTTSISDTQSGLTLTVRRLDNSAFSINDVGAPPAFGTRTIGNFVSAFGTGATLIFNFSAPISSGSISFGDFDADDDGTVTLTAFTGLNGSGSNLGSSSVLYPANLDIGSQGNAAIRTLTVSATGIQSLTILSGGPFPGSLFYDNIIATTPAAAVPEPVSMVLLGSGLAALVVLRRFGRCN